MTCVEKESRLSMIALDRRNGLKVPELAEKYNVSRTTIWRVLRDTNFAQPRLSLYRRAGIVAAVMRGDRVKEIARNFKVHRSTVWNLTRHLSQAA